MQTVFIGKKNIYRGKFTHIAGHSRDGPRQKDG